MNSATNVQPAAGHGNGSVRTQNQPSWSPSESSSQSSSLVDDDRLLLEDDLPALHRANKVARGAEGETGRARAGRRARGRSLVSALGSSRTGVTARVRLAEGHGDSLLELSR